MTEGLIFSNLEKQTKDNILFPNFDLTLAPGEIVAIYSTLNVRKMLLDLLRGKAVPSNGKISVHGKTLEEEKKAYMSAVNICFYEEGLYERLKVEDYFSFFIKLYDSGYRMEELLLDTQLQDKRRVRIQSLTESEKRRVHFGRIIIQNPDVFIFEEPDLNVDMETRRVYVNLAKKLQEKRKASLILTGNLENALTVADQVFRLDENGLHVLQVAEEEESKKEEVHTEEKDDEAIKPFQFNKIPTKVNEKIVLFDPQEIDYVESNDGQSNIYIKGESFPSLFTLNELEIRLQHVGFFRCHRSYIVNLQKVREVITWTRNSYSLILDDKAKSSIPLSKTKMAQLKEMLGLK
ncbi:LytTR family transcriptional regulator DNA-binding domain-containing protein [Oceanobacillus manasiensis]|uniref:LytTR family transcriptional regulator DNA-binding domain-containing protein n=1 Tax=Oceanobacillus manasiensis TaxID=586413 RepID=UPI0005A8F43E|nr:LytTR family transcriptional regulator DNA-binding domain-containing protein [Oceanobacillus manasiensis]